MLTGKRVNLEHIRYGDVVNGERIHTSTELNNFRIATMNSFETPYDFVWGGRYFTVWITAIIGAPCEIEIEMALTGEKPMINEEGIIDV